MNTRKIAAPLALNNKGGFSKNVVLTLEGNVIKNIEENVENIDSLSSVEYYDGVLIPGMVNGHCHLELSYLLGQVGEGKGLVEFIREIMAVRGDFPFELQEQKAIAEDRKMYSEGVQGLCDISNGEASYQAKKTSKIDYYTYAEYFNMPDDDKMEAYYRSVTQHVEPARALGLKISPTPHSNYMVGDKLFLRGVSDAQRLSIHFMETPSEVDYFQKEGKMYHFVAGDDMTPDFLHYGTHENRIIESIPADMPLLLVHNTMITPEQIDKLSAHFKDLTFVICPRSNYFIERAYSPAMLLWQKGVNVSIGTDSLTSNHSLTMALEIDMLMRNNPELPLEVALSWATLGGARAMGKESEWGTFEVGKSGGVVLLEGVDFGTLRPVEFRQLSTRRLL